MNKMLLPFLMILSLSSLNALNVQNDIIDKGVGMIGTPYVYGGINPSGFDCSGLVYYLYKPYVSNLPRVSAYMAEYGSKIDRSHLVPGDLVFFATGSYPRRVTHVAIYIGQDSILHSISNGPDRGVTVTPLSAAYWADHYFSSARILPAGTGEVERVEDRTYAKGTFSGEVVNGEPEGEGVLVMNNGDRYEGDFSDGVFDGSGTYTRRDGTQMAGEFTDGRLPEGQSQEDNYLLTKDSPWESYRGKVEGDYRLWLEAEQNAFEEWKKQNSPPNTGSR